MEQFALEFGPQRRVYKVSELNSAIRDLLYREFQDIWVGGEISGVKLPSSGHYYFTLKEHDSQIRCVMFRSAHRYLKFKPQDGMAVLARGRLDVYEARGDYQLQVEFLEPQGHGALQLAFEQLKKKLAAEGLFEAARRGRCPNTRAVSGWSPRRAARQFRTCSTFWPGAFPGLHIRLYPAQVQGEEAIEDVCRGLQYFSRTGWADVVIVGRGGGSLEDLWTFNEEAVARNIAASKVPVVSAIGHETDFTIADFVADLRAPTPSAAAELVICTRQELLERIAAQREKIVQRLRYSLAMVARRLNQQGVDRATTLLHRSVNRRMQRVDDHQEHLRENMRTRLENIRRTLRGLEARLRYFDLRPRLADDRRLDKAGSAAIQVDRLRIERRRRPLEALAGKLSQLSPLLILDRGYAIVTEETGTIVKSSAEAPPGSRIKIRLARGKLGADVTDIE